MTIYQVASVTIAVWDFALTLEQLRAQVHGMQPQIGRAHV